MPTGALKRRLRIRPEGDTGHIFRKHRTVVEIESDAKKIAKIAQVDWTKFIR